MTSRDFCYWLQGYFEIQGNEYPTLNAEQIKMIKNHLAMVFKHEIDPSMGSLEHQKALQQLHESLKKTVEGGGQSGHSVSQWFTLDPTTIKLNC